MATSVSPSTSARESADGLSPQGITPSGRVHWNLVAPELVEAAIRRNEGVINRNVHKIKKLDGEYKRNYLSGMKHESQGLWQYFNQALTVIPPVNCACKHGEEKAKRTDFNMNATDGKLLLI